MARGFWMRRNAGGDVGVRAFDQQRRTDDPQGMPLNDHALRRQLRTVAQGVFDLA